MTKGVGGSSINEQLALLSNQLSDVKPIAHAEYSQRQAKLCQLMQQQDVAAIYLNAGSNLYYLTGLSWSASERLVGALLFADGSLHYLAPQFEQATINDYMLLEAPFHGWEEHQSPYSLAAELIEQSKLPGSVAIDPSTAFFMADSLAKQIKRPIINGAALCQACRAQKSAAELALLQQAKDISMQVHRAAGRILRPGITTTEVTEFIDQAHRKLGTRGSSFCIVLFGKASSYPHGVKEPQTLQENDWVLIDTGCLVEGYNADITRTYAFGEATALQQQAWQSEQRAQLAAFSAAQLGKPCSAVDAAARRSLEQDGYGPDYLLPGLPHRTGHGCGLDIHEGPYLVRGDETPLAEGMVFSNEPMLVMPEQFGVRLEDHFYMSSAGPRWFTEPSQSLENPFNL